MSLQERIEASRVGRAVISVFVVGTVLAFITWHLPSSPLRSALEPAVAPYVHSVGLEQDWGVFAPNPRSITLGVLAEVEFADGSTTTWHTPAGDPWLGTYRTYRWDKFAEIVRRDDRSFLWEPLARYVARIHDGDGRDVVEVRLARRWYDIPPPGEPADPPPWQRFTFYRLEL